MHSGKTLSHKTVNAELGRLCPWIVGNYTSEDVLRAMDSIVKLVGGNVIFTLKTGFIPIVSSRAKLPDDLVYIEAIASTDAKSVEEAKNLSCSNKLKLTPMQWNSDSFNRKFHCSAKDYHCKSDLKYIVNSNYVFPNFETGVLAISYLSIPIDESGLPEIPAEESWLLAAVWQAAFDITFRMHMMGDIDANKLDRVEFNKCKYVTMAGTSSKMPNKAQTIAYKNESLSSPQDLFPEKNFFLNFGETKGLTYGG